MKAEGGGKKSKLVYSICVSGAHNGPTVADDKQLAKDLGTAIAKAGQTLTTGATIGLPYISAVAAHQAGGKNIGFSPAVSLREHLKKYHLPYECYDFINFTGMNYVGRDLYLVQSSDAIVTIGGGFGSLHEFTSALEAHKICGVLTKSEGVADLISGLTKLLTLPHDTEIIYSDDPYDLVSKIVAALDKKYHDLHRELEHYDEFWYLKDDNPRRGG